jgi:hypothetical protein
MSLLGELCGRILQLRSCAIRECGLKMNRIDRDVSMIFGCDMDWPFYTRDCHTGLTLRGAILEYGPGG